MAVAASIAGALSQLAVRTALRSFHTIFTLVFVMPTAAATSARLIPVALFTAAYLLAAVAAAYQTGNREFVFYIAIMLILIALLAVIHRRVGLSTGVLWALSAWGLLHMAGGLVPLPSGWPYDGEHPVLYSLWLVPQRLKYDQVVHAFGFGVSTWVCWQGLCTAMADSPRGAKQDIAPTFGLLALCVFAGMGCGAANEVVEFVATLTMPETNVGGYVNTGWDLVSNLVGCVAAAVLIRLFSSPRSRNVA